MSLPDPSPSVSRAGGDENALFESEMRMHAVFETAVEGILTIDARGIVETMNAAAERLFGYRRDEVIGRNVSMLMPPPFREEHDGYLERYLAGGTPRIIGIGREVEGVRKDGVVFPLRLAVSEVRLRDRRLFTGFVEDLTERKRLEREAAEWRAELERRVEDRTAELARANRELESFAHIVSHDLRTPLRGIRNYVDFLTEDLGPLVQGESREDLVRLGRAAEELENMIRDLLDYTRIGRVRHPPEDFDPGVLMREIAELAQAGRPGAEVRVGPMPPRLRAPRGMIRQIFQNLVENGLHYNRSDSPLVEACGEVLEEETPARLRFVVKDNGIGIAPEHHERIFQMFQRLHTHADYSGTGIGLAAVRKAVEHMGGSITLRSAVGEGSEFVVELPEDCPG